MASLKRKSPRNSLSHGPKKFHQDRNTEIDSLDNALGYLIKASKGTKKISTNNSLTSSLLVLEHISKTVGLSSEDILSATEVVTSSIINDTACAKIISYLVPTTTIPLQAAQIAISYMCSQKASLNLKAKLVEWLVAVYEFVQSKELLHNLYDVLFHFLKYSTLCADVCHLLFLITQKEDVRPLWVRRLRSIERLMGSQPYILGLLSLYQLYRPDLVTLQANDSNKKFFKPSRVWLHRLQVVKVANASLEHPSVIDDMRRNLVATEERSRGGDVLPPARFVQQDVSHEANIPFHQVQTFQQMVDNIHQIRMPCHIISVLRYRAMRMVLLNRDDPSIITRLSSWIESHLLRELVFYKRNGAYEWRDELLHVFVEFTDDIQEGIPCLEDVLSQYLMTWDGIEHRANILALISRWRICPFERLRVLVLEPLRRLFFRCSVFFKCAVINCLTQLVHYMAMIELARYSCASLQHHSANLSDGSAQKGAVDIFFRSVFPSVVHGQFDVLETFSDLIDFIASLCDAGLMLHTYHPLLMHQVLSFYEEVADLYQSFGIPRLTVMSASVAYHSLFSLDPSIISRSCSLLASNKQTLEYIGEKTDRASSLIKAYGKDYVSTMWTNEAFKPSSGSLIYNKKDGAAYHKLCHVSNQASSTFSIARHPALIGYSQKFAYKKDVMETNEIFQVTENKKNFVRYLHELGYVGMSEFFKVFINQF